MWRLEEMGVSMSKGSLSRIENGEQPYSQPILEALAQALDCEPGDLIMRDPNSPLWSILDNLKALTPEQQRTVAVMVETLRKAS